MVDRTRKMVLKEVNTLDVYCTTLGSLKAEIDRMIEHYGADTVVESDDTYISVKTKRAETDEEMAARIANEEIWEANRDERDRKEFERLKAKFGA